MFRLEITDPILTRKCLEQAKATQDLPSLTFPLPSSPDEIISFINSDRGQIFIDNATAIFDRLKAWSVQQGLRADMLDDIKQRFTRKAVNNRKGFKDFFELCTKGLSYFNGINIRLAEEHRSLIYKKHIVSELLLAVKGKCEDGIDTYAKKACDLLSADPLVLLANVKRHIAEQIANLTLVKYRLGGNQVHYANALINHYHEDLGIDQVFDTLAPLGLGNHVFLEFTKNFAACMVANEFITELAVQFDLALVEEAIKKAVAEQNDIAGVIKTFEMRLDILGSDPLFKMNQLFDQDKLADDEYIFGFGAYKMLRATLIERLRSSHYLDFEYQIYQTEDHPEYKIWFQVNLKNDAVIVVDLKQGECKRLPLICALLGSDVAIPMNKLWHILIHHAPNELLYAVMREINESVELTNKLVDMLSINQEMTSLFNDCFLYHFNTQNTYTNIFIALAQKGLLQPDTLLNVCIKAFSEKGYDKAGLFCKSSNTLFAGPVKLDIRTLFLALPNFPSQIVLLNLIKPSILISYFDSLSQFISFLTVFPEDSRFEIYNIFINFINPQKKGFTCEERADALTMLLDQVVITSKNADIFLNSQQNIVIWATRIKEKEKLFLLLGAVSSLSARERLYNDFIIKDAIENLISFDQFYESLQAHYLDKSNLMETLRVASLLVKEGEAMVERAVSQLSRRELWNEALKIHDLRSISPTVLAKLICRGKSLADDLKVANFPPNFVTALAKYLSDKLNFSRYLDYTKFTYHKNEGYERYIYYAICELPNALAFKSAVVNSQSKLFTKNVHLDSVVAAVKLFFNAYGYKLELTASEKLQAQMGHVNEIGDYMALKQVKDNASVARL